MASNSQIVNWASNESVSYFPFLFYSWSIHSQTYSDLVHVCRWRPESITSHQMKPLQHFSPVFFLLPRSLVVIISVLSPQWPTCFLFCMTKAQSPSLWLSSQTKWNCLEQIEEIFGSGPDQKGQVQPILVLSFSTHFCHNSVPKKSYRNCNEAMWLFDYKHDSQWEFSSFIIFHLTFVIRLMTCGLLQETRRDW